MAGTPLCIEHNIVPLLEWYQNIEYKYKVIYSRDYSLKIVTYTINGTPRALGSIRSAPPPPPVAINVEIPLVACFHIIPASLSSKAKQVPQSSRERSCVNIQLGIGNRQTGPAGFIRGSQIVTSQKKIRKTTKTWDSFKTLPERGHSFMTLPGDIAWQYSSMIVYIHRPFLVMWNICDTDSAGLMIWACHYRMP